MNHSAWAQWYCCRYSDWLFCVVILSFWRRFRRYWFSLSFSAFEFWEVPLFMKKAVLKAAILKRRPSCEVEVCSWNMLLHARYSLAHQNVDLKKIKKKAKHELRVPFGPIDNKLGSFKDLQVFFTIYNHCIINLFHERLRSRFNHRFIQLKNSHRQTHFMFHIPWFLPLPFMRYPPLPRLEIDDDPFILRWKKGRKLFAQPNIQTAKRVKYIFLLWPAGYWEPAMASSEGTRVVYQLTDTPIWNWEGRRGQRISPIRLLA